MEPYQVKRILGDLDSIEAGIRRPLAWNVYHTVIRRLVEEVEGVPKDWDSLKVQLATALRNSGKIASIKLYRKAVGGGLKEAKELIEALMVRPTSAWDKVIVDFYQNNPYPTPSIISLPWSRRKSKRKGIVAKVKKPRLRHREKPKSKKRKATN